MDKTQDRKEKKQRKANAEKEEYIEKIKRLVKKNNNKTYNIQAVAKMLGLPSNLDYAQECILIISYLKEKSKTNKVIKELLEASSNSSNVCDLLVGTLYQLFMPDHLLNRAPIKMSEKKYKELIKKNTEKNISKNEKTELDEALNSKFCHCVKKIYLKNKFAKIFTEKEPQYNPYAICTASIYNKRNIDTPEKVSYTCRDKYDWYRKN